MLVALSMFFTFSLISIICGIIYLFLNDNYLDAGVMPSYDKKFILPYLIVSIVLTVITGLFSLLIII